MTAPTGVRVRGTCSSCGATIDTVAPKGRVTWRGPCPGEGCNRKLVARRVKGKEPATPPVDDSKPPARRRARKGTYDDGNTQPVERPARRRAPARQHDDGAGDTGGNTDTGEHDDGTGGTGETPPPRRVERSDRTEAERQPLIGALPIF